MSSSRHFMLPVVANVRLPTVVTMNSLELKIPPLLVALCVGLLIWLASSAVAPFEMPLLLHEIVGIVFGVVGFNFGFAGFLSFRRAKTTISPTKPMSTSSLVTTGAYRNVATATYGHMIEACALPAKPKATEV